MPRSSVIAAALGVLLSALTAAPDAGAFCRTTTSKVPPDYQPRPGQCWSQGLPLFWRSACVSYSIHQAGSRQVSFEIASTTIAEAFAKWANAACPSESGSRPSIDVRDLGSVTCAKVEYQKVAENQNVIVFRDDAWPHAEDSNTLALTTVVYSPDTGEIYDSDMEINTAQNRLSTTDTASGDGYDFASIVTHEAGHFLGLGHSDVPTATMNARYVPGTTNMRHLTLDDVAAICSIYPPNGTRVVDPSVATDGIIQAGPCDPTPRHGFSAACATAPEPSCGALPRAGGMGQSVLGISTFSLFVMGLLGARRRRLRTPHVGS